MPRRAAGVELIGEYEASGYKTAPALARRGDGQALQLTPILYAALEAVDGRRSLGEIADVIGERIGRQVSEDNARVLVEDKLVACGLVVGPDGAEPDLQRMDPLFALRLRVNVLSERVTNWLTAPFAVLLHPLLVLPAVIAFFAVVAWVLGQRGVAAGTRELLYSPATLVGVFAATALSAGFHEFGHAAALRYSGGRPGGMGAGLYLVWPAFYTDVTDAYRLSRGGRLRTDLGGLYFNALFTLATVAAWRITGVEALLVLVPLQLIQMIQQLLPVVRLDGYHILSDLCGVPDLFARIKPTVKSLVPGQDPEPAADALKPWVRVVVTAWILVVIPLLITALVFAAISFPRLLATAWDSAQLQWQGFRRAMDDGAWMTMAARVLGTVAVLLPVAGTIYMLGRVVRRFLRGAWGVADRFPAGRPFFAVAAAAAIAGLAFLWWPNGEYRPLQRGERGTLADAVRAAREVPSGRPGLTEERQEELDGAPARAADADSESPASSTSTTLDENVEDRLDTPTQTTRRPVTTVRRFPPTTTEETP